jgi:hypothetical protein
LGEEENALPDYSREDILGLAASDPRETNDYATNNNFLPKNFNPYGTTVKLSFTKAEKEKENLEFRSTKLEPETKNVERNSKSQILNSKNDNSEQVVAEEEEVLTTNIINDYIPVYTPPALPVQRKQVRPKIFPKPFLSQKIQKPFEKLWQKIKDRSLFSRQSSQIANVEIADNRELADYQTEYRIETSDLSPPPTQPNLSDSLNPPAPLNQPNNLTVAEAWSNQFLPANEELVIREAAGRTKRFWGILKNIFLTFRSPNAKRSAIVLGIGIIVSLMIPLGAYIQKVIEAKNRIEEQSNKAYENVKSAKSALVSAKPEEARKNFASAYQNFLDANKSLDEIGGSMLSIIKVLPGGSKVKSGENLLEAGKHLSFAGQIVSEAFDVFLGDQGALKKKFLAIDNLSTLKESSNFQPVEKNDRAKNLTNAILLFQEKLNRAKGELEQTASFLDRVKINDLPEGKREEFVLLRDKLPTAVAGIDSFSNYANIILTILGHKISKQYLFLFQNNDEVRATGGFIGTYGILKLEEGNVSQLMVDGIYNPDGQLKERIIPPKPIQKMSATWSMHDANWWPDFPKSAEKVAWFYEKTGGPAVDGVIAFTPKMLQELLKITGPINHEKYGAVITADNFVEITQNKVEVEYDRKLNRPKQFLADLAPIILEKIFNAPPEKWIEIMSVFSDCLEDRSILMYFFDYNVQKAISNLGWSGEILSAPKDYFSVVNTNISGLKTDHVIEQRINHLAEIKPDGSIVDTLTISRTHQGGKEKYDWYNGVNSDWMRIYVPKGSELLRAEGYTREVDSPPVDYEKLGFIEDEMVIMEESNTNIDPYTGTRTYEDSDKTVFANWTYVSPGETLTVKYTYLLPWKLTFDDIKKPADTYSLLAQKQAGDENSWIESEVKGLEEFDLLYRYPDNLGFPEWSVNQKFSKDLFAGMVLAPKGTKKEY